MKLKVIWIIKNLLYAKLCYVNYMLSTLSQSSSKDWVFHVSDGFFFGRNCIPLCHYTKPQTFYLWKYVPHPMPPFLSGHKLLNDMFKDLVLGIYKALQIVNIFHCRSQASEKLLCY